MAAPFEGGKSPDFHVSQKWLKVYQGLCGRTSLVKLAYPLFKKYTNLYTLCAVIGYNMNKKEKLTGKIETPFTLEQIDEKTEWPVLISIAWIDARHDMTIFRDSKRIISICDQYAETGMRRLIDEDPFDKIFDREGNLMMDPSKYKLEYNTALLVQGYKKQFAKLLL